MQRNRIIIKIIASSALFMVATQAAAENNTFGYIGDIRIQASGSIHGQMPRVDSGSTVHVLRNGHVIASVPSDANGRFTVPGLRGGTYELSSGKSRAIVRAWSPGTAPPIAGDTVTLDQSSSVGTPAHRLMGGKVGRLPPLPPLQGNKRPAS